MTEPLCLVCRGHKVLDAGWLFPDYIRCPECSSEMGDEELETYQIKDSLAYHPGRSMGFM